MYLSVSGVDPDDVWDVMWSWCGTYMEATAGREMNAKAVSRGGTHLEADSSGVNFYINLCRGGA